MINKAIKILITSVVISVLTGCSIFGIIGSGNRVEEERIVDSFTSINLSCVADIVITQGSEQSVVISVDDNLISYVKTSVRNGNLSISTTETINSNIGAKVYVTVTEFKGFTMDGVGDAEINNVNADELSLTLGGVGQVDATGSCNRLNAQLEGTGDMDLSGLIANSTNAEISGVGDMEVYAVEDISLNLSGVGDLTYYGTAAILEFNDDGVGSIDKGN